MSDTTRTVLIAAGVAILVVTLLPLLFMAGMMSMMGSMMNQMPMMPGGMAVGILLFLALIVLGVTLLALGLRGQSGQQPRHES